MREPEIEEIDKKNWEDYLEEARLTMKEWEKEESRRRKLPDNLKVTLAKDVKKTLKSRKSRKLAKHFLSQVTNTKDLIAVEDSEEVLSWWNVETNKGLASWIEKVGIMKPTPPPPPSRFEKLVLYFMWKIKKLTGS